MVSVYSPFGPPVSALSRSLTLLAALVLLVATLPVALSLPRPAVERGAGIAPFAVLPLAFVPNVGQTDAAVLMETRSAAGTVSFLADEVAFTFPNVSEPVRIVFDGVNTTPTIVSADPLPGRVNDLRGTDPAQWHTDIPPTLAWYTRTSTPASIFGTTAQVARSKAPTPSCPVPTRRASGGAIAVSRASPLTLPAAISASP